MLIMRTHVKREPCRRCHILRLFLVMVLAIAIIGLTMGDLFRQLGGIQPIFFGYVFAGLAIFTFAVKFVAYQRGKTEQTLSDKTDS